MTSGEAVAGPPRWRRTTAVAGGVAAILLLALGPGTAPAAAQTPPAPPPGSPPTAVPAATVPATALELDVAPLDAAPLPAWAGGAAPEPCAGEETTGSIVPDDCWGRFPSSHYDIGFDEGAWNHLGRKLYGTLTDLAFTAARTATALSLWLVGWAYGFGVYQRLGAVAVDIAGRYDAEVVGPLGLAHLAWFYAVAWAAVAALRGRLTMAAGELVTSVVAAGLAGVVLANPAGYLAGTFDTMGTLSGAVLATGTGHPPPRDPESAQAVLRPLQARVHGAFVEQPYDHLAWGGPLAEPCAAARDRIVATGPHGSDDEPRAVMAAAGCEDQAEFNADANGTRLSGAALTALAAAVTTVLLVLVAATVVVAQVVVVVLFAVAPFAVLAAVLPGAGRELAWRWVAGLARAGLAVVGMSLVLSLLLLGVSGALEASGDLGLVERFAVVNTVVVAMVVARKRILAAGHGLANSFGQRLATRRAGGERAAPWLPAAAVGGASGFALAGTLGPDRSSRSARLASAGGRNWMANRRLARSQRGAEARAERRSAAVVARQRTEVGTDGDGRPVTRTTVSVDGPAAATRRARAARARVERRVGAQVAATARRRATGWSPPAPPRVADDVADPEPPVDVEEA